MRDSLKVEITSKVIDKIAANLEHSQNETSIWDTLTPLLIGAGLTLLTQLLIELWKSKKENKKRRKELISKGQAKLYLLTQIIKDLAMYKVHKQYYLRGHYLEPDKKDKEDSFKKHYDKGQEQRLTEAKLDANIAEYFELVTEYSVLASNKEKFQHYFQKIFSYEHPKASKFVDCKTSDELVTELEKEEQRLNKEYKNFYGVFEEIQKLMK